MSFNILNYLDKFGEDDYKEIIEEVYTGKPNVEADLIIFIGGRSSGEAMEKFANISKFQQDDDGRVRVGYIYFNYLYHKLTESFDTEHRKYLLRILFMHMFIHLLGFDKEVFLKKGGFLDIQRVNNRLYTQDTLSENQYVVNNPEVVKFAKKYFGDDGINYVELSKPNEFEDLSNSHWEGRILLGDIMTLDLYYPEQVISEFTLILLEQ
jgi:hypothetical protein